jgi:tetratricopeptide (TPR) repeat protein
LLLVLLTTAAMLAAVVLVRQHREQPQPLVSSTPVQHSLPAEYAGADVCFSCHQEIARTFSATGMGRSFSTVRSDLTHMTTRRPVYHAASDRYYTMTERGGTLYQRRYQIGFDGKETNVLELKADYVVGSGNHARTFLNRNADGRLVQLPLSWYAERGGYWAMSPGYDRSAHLDFRRVIDAGCMSCHNGYPRTPVEDDPNGPKFGDGLPEGIDCQRCHGPGRAHIEAINMRDLDRARAAIVNPATLDRERQLETCMQCHLESTSSPLPFQIRRAEHPAFSYAPGQPLSDYFIHFDHAPGTGHDDTFEIASGAYRLRKSACFQRSNMTCSTCHDPHDIRRGPEAVQRYVTVCQSCHRDVHRGRGSEVRDVKAGATCVDCHMPKRRAEDAVHVVMTDHYIQRHKPPRDLLADRTETASAGRDAYRGEVVLYYPPTLAPTPDNELYQAVAQVQQGSNVSVGIQRLLQAIDTYRPARADFYFELGRAYSFLGDFDADIRWCREALRHDPAFVPALKELASASTSKGDLLGATAALEKAVALRPDDGNAFADLGSVYLQLGRLDDSQRALRQALAIDPGSPRANNTMGLAALKKSLPDIAETHFREAIRMQPDLAEAHNNLGNLLAGRRAYPEAKYHFERAIRSDPNYANAYHSYGVVLALTHAYPQAVAALETAVRLAPRPAQAHIDLADVLAGMGRVAEARAHLETAAKIGDADARDSAMAALRALQGSRQSP